MMGASGGWAGCTAEGRKGVAHLIAIEICGSGCGIEQLDVDAALPVGVAAGGVAESAAVAGAGVAAVVALERRLGRSAHREQQHHHDPDPRRIHLTC